MSNVKLNTGFSQVCVWPGTLIVAEGATVSPADIKLFTDFFVDQMGCRVQYLESIVTQPDRNARGNPINGTGGRTDVLLAIHDEDVAKFALPRLRVGIRWLEDVYGNKHGNLYPARVVDYMTWAGYKEEYSVTA